jgi:hypothetical protein
MMARREGDRVNPENRRRAQIASLRIRVATTLALAGPLVAAGDNFIGFPSGSI